MSINTTWLAMYCSSWVATCVQRHSCMTMLLIPVILPPSVCSHACMGNGDILIPLQTGPCLNIKKVFPVWGISIIKMRRSSDRLIFIMGIPILVSGHLYIEMGPRSSGWNSIWFHWSIHSLIHVFCKLITIKLCLTGLLCGETTMLYCTWEH